MSVVQPAAIPIDGMDESFGLVNQAAWGDQLVTAKAVVSFLAKEAVGTAHAKTVDQITAGAVGVPEARCVGFDCKQVPQTVHRLVTGVAHAALRREGRVTRYYVYSDYKKRLEDEREAGPFSSEDSNDDEQDPALLALKPCATEGCPFSLPFRAALRSPPIWGSTLCCLSCGCGMPGVAMGHGTCALRFPLLGEPKTDVQDLGWLKMTSPSQLNETWQKGTGTMCWSPEELHRRCPGVAMHYNVSSKALEAVRPGGDPVFVHECQLKVDKGDGFDPWLVTMTGPTHKMAKLRAKLAFLHCYQTILEAARHDVTRNIVHVWACAAKNLRDQEGLCDASIAKADYQMVSTASDVVNAGDDNIVGSLRPDLNDTSIAKAVSDRLGIEIREEAAPGPYAGLAQSLNTLTPRLEQAKEQAEKTTETAVEGKCSVVRGQPGSSGDGLIKAEEGKGNSRILIQLPSGETCTAQAPSATRTQDTGVLNEAPVVAITGTALAEFDGSSHGPTYLTVATGTKMGLVAGVKSELGWFFAVDLATRAQGWIPIAYFEADGAVPPGGTSTAIVPYAGGQEDAHSPSDGETSSNQSVQGAAAGTLPGDDVPEELKCCITNEVMQQPVITSDGHTYDQTAITRWLEGHATSPKTGRVLPDKVLRPNHSMRAQIITWRERQGLAPLPPWEPSDQETVQTVPGPTFYSDDRALMQGSYSDDDDDMWVGFQPAPMLPASRAMCRVARHETYEFAYPITHGLLLTKIVPVSVLRRALQNDRNTGRGTLISRSDDVLLNSFVDASGSADTMKHHGIPRFSRTVLDFNTMRPADERAHRALQWSGEPCLIVRLKAPRARR